MNPGYEPEPDANDLALAALLADGVSSVVAPAGDRELLDAVASLRGSYASHATDRARSERMWVAIQQATLEVPAVKAVGARRAPRYPWWRLPVLRWGLAAAMVILAVWMSRPSAPDWSTVVEAADTAVEYRSPDGSVITVRPRSRLEAFGSNGRTYRISGEAFFDVVGDGVHAFTVEGGGATVTVLGTRFVVGTWTGVAEVFLEEGRVRLEDRAFGRSTDLLPGQRAVRSDAGGFAVEDGSRDEAIDWMQGALVFTSRPLSAVIDEIEHHFGIEVVLPAELSGDLLTGRVMLGTRDAALADLAVVLGGRFVASADGRFRFER